MSNAVIGALRVVLGLDSAHFTKGLAGAQKSLQSAAQSMKDVGAKMAGIGAIMSATITAPIVALGVAATNAAIEVEEMQSAFETSFGSMAAATEKWAETTGDAMGRSTFVLQKMALGFNGLFKAGGPASEQATEMSKRFTALAQDLAAFHNMAEDDAFMALRSGLSGEAEPLRKFNVYLTEGALKAEAYALGIAKSGAKLTEHQKIQARASLILKNTTEAHGDVIRTADGTEGRIRRMRAQWSELTVELAQRLLPVVGKVAAALGDLVLKFSELSPRTQNTILAVAGLAAVLGPALLLLGGTITAVGNIATVILKMNAALITATGATSTLAAGMVVLRGAMAFLTGPWGLVIMGVATAMALLSRRQREAVVASEANRAATVALDKATGAYAEAAEAAATATAKDRAMKLEAAKAAREQVAAERRLTAEKLASAQASLAQARADLIKLHTVHRYNTRGDAPMPIGMSGDSRRIQANAEQAQANVTLLTDSIKATNEAIAQADQQIASATAGLAAATEIDSSGGGKKSGGKSADELAREAEQRRRAKEDYDHELALQEAILKGDQDRVRILERQGDVRDRTRTLIDQEIVKGKEAAAAEAERAQQRLEAAREEALIKEDLIARAEWERRLWQIDGRNDMVQRDERRALLAERIAFWRTQERDEITATAMATSELAEWDQARAEAAERAMRAHALDLEIQKARLRGDQAAERRLSRRAEIDDLTERYKTREHNPLSETAARAQAQADVASLDEAKLQGHYRDFVKDGWRAAMDGDLAGFAKDWVKDWASRGLEESLNNLGDLLMRLFSNIDWGKGPGGGVNLGSIGSGLGGLLKSIPGFSTGGSFKVGGSGSVDSKLISMRLTPGEMVDIRRPGQLQPANNNSPMHFDLRGAVMTQDLLAQMQGMAAQSSGNALNTARVAVPADRAKSDRYKLGRR